MRFNGNGYLVHFVKCCYMAAAGLGGVRVLILLWRSKHGCLGKALIGVILFCYYLGVVVGELLYYVRYKPPVAYLVGRRTSDLPKSNLIAASAGLPGRGGVSRWNDRDVSGG